MTWGFKWDPYIGVPIVDVITDADGDWIELVLPGGVRLRGDAYGDCCSNTWIEHLEMPTDIVGGAIMGYKDSEGVEVDSKDYECLKVYHSAIRTTRGEIVIEYRNSSNGYYGGYLEWEKQ